MNVKCIFIVRANCSAMAFELERHLAIFSHNASFTVIDKLWSYFRQPVHYIIKIFVSFRTVEDGSRLESS